LEIPAVSVAYFILYDADHFASESYCKLYLACFETRLRGWEAVRQLEKGGLGFPMGCEVSLLSPGLVSSYVW
jgi:hypothetical protein